MNLQELTFEIKKGTQAFLIALSPAAYAVFRVMGPDGGYKGYIMTGFKFPPIYFASEFEATMNAKRHQPISGEYTLQIITLDDSIDQSTFHFDLFTDEEAHKLLGTYGPSVLAPCENLWKATHEEGEARYYKGDLHAHTFLSDGVLTGPEVNAVLKEKAMDFIAITDHNLVPLGFEPLSAIHIPSFELTLPKGHLNIHGLLDPDIYKAYFSMKDLSLNEMIRAFLPHSHVAINHPFFPPWDFLMDDLDLSLINAIEIICDPTYPGSDLATEKAVSFLDFAWSKGITIYAVGGSDSHSDSYGDPMTHVFSKNSSVAGIIDGLKKGHILITRDMDLSLSYHSSEGELLPGSRISTIKDIKHIDLELKTHVSTVYEIRVISNGQIIAAHHVALKSGESYAHSFDDFECEEGADFNWLRLEILDAKGQWVGYANPIYQGEPQKEGCKWGELMEAYIGKESKG